MLVNNKSPMLTGIGGNKQNKGMEALRKAVDLKGEFGKETFEEALERIENMKNTDKELERISEVKEALLTGKLEREPDKIGKKLSKKEVMDLYGYILEEKRQGRIKEIRKSIPNEYVTVRTLSDLEALEAFLKDAIGKGKVIGFDIETFSDVKGGALDMHVGSIAGFSVGNLTDGYYLPLQHKEETALNKEMSHEVLMQRLKPLLEGVKTVMHNAPFDCKWMLSHYNIDMVRNLFADTRQMAFMSNEEEPNHQLKHLTQAWLGEEADFFNELFPNTDGFNEVPLDIASYYAIGDTVKTARLYMYIINVWNTAMKDIKKLYFETELPVQKSFIYSDLRGITLDFKRNEELYEQQVGKTEQLQKEIETMYGQEINLNSPVQVAEMLYDHFKLPNISFKRKTDKDTLNKLAEYHEVVKLLNKYRAESKLLSSFTKTLVEKAKDGVIHPEHNTLGAKTGRFTCKNPNTQQIPSRREEFRTQFTAREGHFLMAIDYSQIELRVLAHDANDTVLIDAFINGMDIHSKTGELISGIPYEQVQAEKDTSGTSGWEARRKAKTVNFGIVYGMGAYSLAKNIGVSEEEAQEVIDNYFKGYPGIKLYMDRKKKELHNTHCVRDMFGRIRNFHNLMKSRDEYKKFGAERQAGNFPIQSGAGVVLKKAIVNLQPILEKWGVNILLQVHDELVFECPNDLPVEAVREIKHTMENVVELKVPLKADVDVYPERWAEGVDPLEWFGEEI